MSSVNKVILVGNLGANPTSRQTGNGTAVASFVMATSEVWSRKSSDQEKRTEWHRVVAWARLAEIASSYLKKGSLVYVEGRLQTRSWEDDSGATSFVTEVIANRLVMLDRAASAKRDEVIESAEPSADDVPAVAASNDQESSS
jgi:single-strand DNA-binding protein